MKFQMVTAFNDFALIIIRYMGVKTAVIIIERREKYGAVVPNEE